MLKPISSYKAFVRGSQFLIVILIISSCTLNSPDQSNTSSIKNTQKPPVTITGWPPHVTLLDACPLPRTIAIPQKKSDSYNIKSDDGSKNIQILPPEIKSAGFFLSMQTFTTRNGLTNNKVQKGCADKNGNLWFCTFGGGVSRYDGKTFTNYTEVQGLASNNIWTVFEDKSGNFWFGTFGAGVSRYDGHSFKTYTTTQGLPDNTVWGITEDKNGNLWFGTGKGICRMDHQGKFEHYKTNPGYAAVNVSCILNDKNGNIWFGTWGDDGVTRFDGITFNHYTATDGLANNGVRCIFEEKNGNIWFGNNRGKISLLNSQKNLPNEKPAFINYTIADDSLDKEVHAITGDNKGNLWIGTKSGVFQLSLEKRTNPGKADFTRITTLHGLPNNNVNSIVEDKSGNIWFGMDPGGIALLDGDLKSLTSLTIGESLLRNTINAILEQGNYLWIGTFGGTGLMRLAPDRKSVLIYSTSQGLKDNTILTIFEDKRHNIWFSTFDGGVTRLNSDGKSLTVYTSAQGLPDNSIIKFIEDKNGNIWFGSMESGVSRLSSDSRSMTHYTTNQGLPDNTINSIIEDKNGTIWFGTNNGISKLSPDGKAFINYTTEQGLANKTVTGILEDNSGNIWISTNGGGISRFDGRSFVSYTASQGLSDDKIKDIAMDKNGIIWLGTYRGLTALKGFVRDVNETSNQTDQKDLHPSNDFSNIELESRTFKPVFEIYNSKTGYPLDEITSNICVTHENIVWAGSGTREKSIRIDYSRMHKNQDPPKVFLQSIKLKNEDISWYDLNYRKEGNSDSAHLSNITEELSRFGKILDEDQRQNMRKKFSTVRFDSISRFYSLPLNLVLPYEHNNITFDFLAIEPARPALLRYQYMLEGYENVWSPASDKASATYGNIHEGRYTFKLRAQSPDGVWSSTLTYSFKVLPPWYRAWWAYVLYALLFFAGVWRLIRWRVRILKKEKLLLEQKVADRTHELKDEKEKVERTLTELKSTQAQLIQSEKMASLGELTAGIAHEIQNPLNFVNNFSEVNGELIEELTQAAKAGRIDEVTKLAQEIKDNEKKIVDHGKRADSIVKGMLLHSRAGGGQKEATDFNALCDEYFRLAFHGMRAKDKTFNATITTKFDNAIGKIVIIPQDIGRVILNLLNNAFYAVHEKKKQVPDRYEPLVSVSTEKLNGKVIIMVKDNGNGIPENIVNKIFQPFFTTRPTGQGTGLGLSLAYDIVKAHGGEIKVDTREGHGTTFIIQLPVQR